MTVIERQRLETLIGFLDVLPRSKFRFDTVITKQDENLCGTVCCAIGWTPQLFPDLVAWTFYGVRTHTYLCGEPCLWYGSVASKLFGMPEAHAEYLFTPRRKFSSYVPNGMPKGFRHALGKSTSPKTVAAMLRRYLKALDYEKSIHTS